MLRKQMWWQLQKTQPDGAKRSGGVLIAPTGEVKMAGMGIAIPANVTPNQDVDTLISDGLSGFRGE